MKLRDYVYWLKEDLKAYRRGERRIAPKGTVGRIYERKDGTTSNAGLSFTSKGQPRASLDILITRADGSVERRAVPVEVANG